MFGTFVPNDSGHLPIDYHQKMEYHIFNNKNIIINKNPSPLGEEPVFKLRRGWVSSQQFISPQGQRKLHLLPDLINLVIDL